MLSTAPLCPSNAAVRFPSSVRNTRAQRSLPAVAISPSSGENASAFTVSECGSGIVSNAAPSAVFHNFTSPLRDGTPPPVANTRASDENASAVTRLASTAASSGFPIIRSSTNPRRPGSRTNFLSARAARIPSPSAASSTGAPAVTAPSVASRNAPLAAACHCSKPPSKLTSAVRPPSSSTIDLGAVSGTIAFFSASTDATASASAASAAAPAPSAAPCALVAVPVSRTASSAFARASLNARSALSASSTAFAAASFLALSSGAACNAAAATRAASLFR